MDRRNGDIGSFIFWFYNYKCSSTYPLKIRIALLNSMI